MVNWAMSLSVYVLYVWRVCTNTGISRQDLSVRALLYKFMLWLGFQKLCKAPMYHAVLLWWCGYLPSLLLCPFTIQCVSEKDFFYNVLLTTAR